MKRPGDRTKGGAVTAAALAAVVLCIGIVAAARATDGYVGPQVAGQQSPLPAPLIPQSAVPAWPSPG